MDQGDRAYEYANGKSLLLYKGWYRPGQEQELSDQRFLAIVEAKGFRSLQQPEHWSDYYKTEEEKWRTPYKKEILLKESKDQELSSVISELLQRFSRSIKKKLVG